MVGYSQLTKLDCCGHPPKTSEIHWPPPGLIPTAWLSLIPRVSEITHVSWVWLAYKQVILTCGLVLQLNPTSPSRGLYLFESELVSSKYDPRGFEGALG